MLDIKLLRKNLDGVASQLARRGFTLDTAKFQALEDRRKLLQSATQDLQNERNTRSKLIGQAKAKGEDIQPLLAEVADLGDKLKEAEQELTALQADIDQIIMGIPTFWMNPYPREKAKMIMSK